jgi:HSP20 family protein
MAISARRASSPASPVTGWDPLRDLGMLEEQLGQLLHGARPDTGTGWLPAVDVEETGDAWIVEAELPGVKPDDVHVEVRDQELAIFGEIKERKRAGVLRRRTRRVGRFDYHVTLPGETDPEQIDATLKDGVLTVRIAKPKRGRPRQIEIGAD